MTSIFKDENEDFSILDNVQAEEQNYVLLKPMFKRNFDAAHATVLGALIKVINHFGLEITKHKTFSKCYSVLEKTKDFASFGAVSFGTFIGLLSSFESEDKSLEKDLRLLLSLITSGYFSKSDNDTVCVLFEDEDKIGFEFNITKMPLGFCFRKVDILNGIVAHTLNCILGYIFQATTSPFWVRTPHTRLFLTETCLERVSIQSSQNILIVKGKGENLVNFDTVEESYLSPFAFNGAATLRPYLIDVVISDSEFSVIIEAEEVSSKILIIESEGKNVGF